MATYSFKDVVAAINGPGGSTSLASEAGSAQEGITIEAVEDKNVMTIGADGSVMHSLLATRAATVTIRLLKTSPVNAVLQTMYNLQTQSSATHGKNVITVQDVARGDNISLSQVAFKKLPVVTYAREGGNMEWTFDAGKVQYILGAGTPEVG